MQRLPSFAQSARRFYTQMVYCFPYDDKTPKRDTIQHLRASLQRLQKQHPLLAGTLHTSHDDIVSILPGGGNIPLEVFITGSTHFDSCYSRLAHRGFPPHLFVHPSFELNNKLKLEEGPIPACHVRATFIPGGLLIWLSIHNIVGDDHCLGFFAECFAAATRRQPLPAGIPYSPELNLPTDPVWSPATLATLARECPEFDVLLYPGETPSFPAAVSGGLPAGAIPKAGKIFLFHAYRLEQLRNLVYYASGPGDERPSIEACLSALCLTYVTKARLATEVGFVPKENPHVADLFMPVNWRESAFERETANYFGNAMITLPTQIPLTEVQDACVDVTMDALEKLVTKINASLATVDTEAVTKRNALFHRVGDCRRLLLQMDPRRPVELEFDTWKTLGADATWNIPGVTSGRPGAVRRVQGDWNIGNALLLPARSNSRMYELCISLPKVSMEALCQDKGWMAWVDKVLE